MASNPAAELASTLQSASIKHHPDPAYDANPSTTASRKIPVRIHRASSPQTSPYPADANDLPDDDDDDDDDEIPLSALRAPPRRSNLPPLPDLRFEQSYLARIRDAHTWQAVAYITVLDHVFMPLSQGVVWNLLLFGWRRWHTGARFSGRGVGARVRRWWWGVNNWKLPAEGLKVE